MKLLEIKNNLVKLEYDDSDNVCLGKFIIIAGENKSYIAQFVNIKSSEIANYCIARMLFNFSSEGVIENYDGTLPSMESEISSLADEELLQVLPVETPIQISYLAQSEDVLAVDTSVFEQNFTVFSEKNSDKVTFISNCVRQLFQMREKSVVIDNAKLFNKYPRIKFSKDFKLPLNADLIDFIFDNDLDNVDANTKAVIKDIFYDVQNYIKTLEYGFLPIDNFVEVVSTQYKELNMPELALLKNKLLKYRDANIFANTKEEFLALNETLEEKNFCVIDISEAEEPLQKEIIAFVHKALEEIDKYIYLFVNLNDENSDKKLIKKMINHDHVFTTIITSSNYKYANELKSYADNMVLFAPLIKTNEYAQYSTFIDKLNPSECIILGKLTQGVPFICEMTDLNLDLTIDDVFGDKYEFVPAQENEEEKEFNSEEEFIREGNEEEYSDDGQYDGEDEDEEEYSDDDQYDGEDENEKEYSEDDQYDEDEENEEEYLEDISDLEPSEEMPQEEIDESEQIENILEEDDGESYESQEDTLEDESFEEEENLGEVEENNYDELDFSDAEFSDEELNLIENTDEPEDEQEQNEYFEEEEQQMVPVYPADDDISDSENIGYSQGDEVTHPRYGRGVIEKIIKYGNKTLCSISFENVGRRLLDPSISEFEKV